MAASFTLNVSGGMSRRLLSILATLAVLATLAGNSYAPGPASAQTPFADPAFQRVWERTDRPIIERRAARTWMWGEQPYASREEEYLQGGRGLRRVQYFDKSRMEINNPSGNQRDPFYVTNGLLVVEMMSGQVQVGNGEFVSDFPAAIAVAGDLNDPAQTAPTYLSMARVSSLSGGNTARQSAPGTPITAVIEAGGSVRPQGGPSNLARVAAYSPETGHNIADVFWQFLNSSGPVYEGGRAVNGPLMSWIYVMGYPISEAYWTTIRVGGASRQVLVQAFQRRVLTYSPNNPSGWKVEMGNVGLHYHGWRYSGYKPGFVFVNGKYVAPPYAIDSVNGDIRVNGQVVRSLPREVSSPPITPSSNPQTASDLIEVAFVRLKQLHGVKHINDVTPTIRADLINLLKSYPATAEVRDGETAISVVDQAGVEAELVFPVISAPTREELLAGQNARAQNWASLARSGGTLLIFPSASLHVPEGRVSAFLDSLLEITQQPEPSRLSRLEALTGSPSIARSLLEAGGTYDSLRERLPWPSAALEVSSITALAVSPPYDPGDSGGRRAWSLDPESHRESDTPWGNTAYIFLTVGTSGQAESLVSAAILHHYKVIQYESTLNTPGTSTIDNFLATSGQASILYVAAHGGPGTLHIEQYDTKAQRDAAFLAYRARGLNLIQGMVDGTGLGTTDYTLAVSSAHIWNFWAQRKPSETIVQLMSCYGASLAASFNSREFIAATGEIPFRIDPGRYNIELWERIGGRRDNGTKRNVSAAFQAAFAGTQYRLTGHGQGRTVLSPAVISHLPLAGAIVNVGNTVEGTIAFDTTMDTSRPRLEEYVLGLRGCDARMVEARWLNDRRIYFKYVPRQAGSMDIVINPLFSHGAVSAVNKAFLDGNQEPFQTNHIGPNGDQYRWTVNCVGSGGPPPSTPTVRLPGSPTPQPTTTPRPTDTPQPTSTSAPYVTNTTQPTATATGPAPTATSSTNLFDGIYLDISATHSSFHGTFYEVHFENPALEAQRDQYQFSWALTIPVGNQCNALGFAVNSVQPWKASWLHRDCVHSPEEYVTVIVTRNNQSVQIRGPALGPAQIRP